MDKPAKEEPKVPTEFKVLQVTEDFIVLDAGEDRVIHASFKENANLELKKGDTVRTTHTRVDKDGLPSDPQIVSVSTPK